MLDKGIDVRVVQKIDLYLPVFEEKVRPDSLPLWYEANSRYDIL
jgi:hypothetical protein